MTTKVEKSLLVNVPVSTAYNQWTQFEDFPQFMSGVQSVTQLSDDRIAWVAEIASVRRQWEARIVQQVPDQIVSWAATEGATNAGSVSFEDVGGGQTSVRLVLEYEPEGLVETVGDKLNVVENQAERDLERFKSFIEAEGYASGAWRESVGSGQNVGTPGVEDASGSRGDDGKAGVSGKAVAAGVGLAAAAAGAAVAASAQRDSDDPTDPASAEQPSTAPTAVPTPPASAAPPADAGTAAPPHVYSPEEVESGAAGPLTANEQAPTTDQGSQDGDPLTDR